MTDGSGYPPVDSRTMQYPSNGNPNKNTQHTNTPYDAGKSLIIDFVTRGSCRHCRQVFSEFVSVLEPVGNIHLRIFDLDQPTILPENRQGIITPALWVEDRLWFLGTFDREKFRRKMTWIRERS